MALVGVLCTVALKYGWQEQHLLDSHFDLLRFE